MMPRNMHRASLPTPSLLDDYRLSFDHLTRMRVLINLHLAGLACVSFRRRCNRTKVGSRVKQVDHVLQAIAIFCAKIAKLRFKFNLFFETGIALESLESLELVGEVFFKLAGVCKLSHLKPLLDVLHVSAKKTHS